MISKVLGDGGMREALREKAKTRALEFCWRRYTEELLGEFDALVGGEVRFRPGSPAC